MTKPKCCHGGSTEHFKFKKLFPHLKKCKVTDHQNECLGNSMVIDKVCKDDLNHCVPAIFTFIGQFVDHDITLNMTESFREVAGHDNSRTPYLELDSVYGRGPECSPELYNKHRTHLLWNKKHHDLNRDCDGVAIIGDPRNDENLVIAQLQLLFIRFHNKIVDYTLSKCKSKKEAFEWARAIVIKYYQSMVVNDYLTKIVHRCVIEEIVKRGNKYYKPGKEFWFPHEYSIAAFRYGHATVLEEYQINAHQRVNFETLFTDRKSHLDWSYFVKIDKRVHPQATKKITTTLVKSLTEIPGHPPPPLKTNSLPVRNLFRSKQYDLACGQDVAKEMCKEVVDLCSYKVLKKLCLEDHTPLWFYILAEAEQNEDGLRLGQVGSCLVAEVIMESIKRSRKFTKINKKLCVKKVGDIKDASIAMIIAYVEGLY